MQGSLKRLHFEDMLVSNRLYISCKMFPTRCSPNYSLKIFKVSIILIFYYKCLFLQLFVKFLLHIISDWTVLLQDLLKSENATYQLTYVQVSMISCLGVIILFKNNKTMFNFV